MDRSEVTHEASTVTQATPTVMQAAMAPASAVPGMPLPADGYSRDLCERLAALRFDQIPPAVLQTIKLFLVDTLGVIAGARGAPALAELDRRYMRWERGGSATALLSRLRVSPPTAALLNGSAAHALDFDDQHDPARVHTNCVMLPTLLAVAEDVGGMSGERFLLAYAIGAEMHARLGLGCFNSLGKGWHPTMTFGTLAGSLAAARLLGLDAGGLSDALGLAHHQAGGSAQSARDGALSKRVGAGFAARNAVTAACLAADGIGGTRRTLEGSAGLFALQERGEVDAALIVDGLGQNWHIRDYSFKPHPCCRCNHTTIGLGIALHAEGVAAQDIESVEIAMGAVNRLTVGAAYEPARDSIVQAQFNASYSFAAALVDGEVGLRHYRRPAITDARYSELAARTRVVADPAIPATAIEPARVRLRMRAGEIIERRSDRIKGSPSDPMSEADVIRKFRACIESGFGASAAADSDRLIERVFALERSRDVGGDLTQAFPV